MPEICVRFALGLQNALVAQLDEHFATNEEAGDSSSSGGTNGAVAQRCIERL